MLVLRAADDANRVPEVITLRSRDPPPSLRWWSRSRQSQTSCGLFGLVLTFDSRTKDWKGAFRSFQCFLRCFVLHIPNK